MNDRELLKLAAKAAGIEVVGVVADGIPHRFGGGYWNPITDDGDALRLAVKLNIDVMHTNIHGPQVNAMADYEVACIENGGKDPYAATRRAIVRAAAEIGKQMEDE